MSLKLVDGAGPAEQNNNYALMLEGLAAEIRASEGIYSVVLVHALQPGAVVRQKMMVGHNLNLFEITGVLEFAKAQMLQQIGSNPNPGKPR